MQENAVVVSNVRKGEKHYAAKLSIEKVQQIRAAMLQTPKPQMKDLAKLHGVSVVAVWKVVHRKSWRDVE